MLRLHKCDLMDRLNCVLLLVIGEESPGRLLGLLQCKDKKFNMKHYV